MKHGIWRCQGYRQGHGKHNGFIDRRDQDATFYKGHDDVVVLELAEWSDDMRQWCDRIFTEGITHLHCVGHSYGVGRGFRALFKQIIKRNKRERKQWIKVGKENGMPWPRRVDIISAVSNDGVDRGGILPITESFFVRLLQFRSITPAALINLPKNSVRFLYAQKQSNRIPKGHQIKHGKILVQPDLHNADSDGAILVHHDADPEKGERDFDESLVSRELELKVFNRHIG